MWLPGKQVIYAIGFLKNREASLKRSIKHNWEYLKMLVLRENTNHPIICEDSYSITINCKGGNRFAFSEMGCIACGVEWQMVIC